MKDGTDRPIRSEIIKKNIRTVCKWPVGPRSLDCTVKWKYITILDTINKTNYQQNLKKSTCPKNTVLIRNDFFGQNKTTMKHPKTLGTKC